MQDPPVRRRRSVEDARREILDAAERLLASGGPEAVRVQTVAREIGVSDAAVHYHFGSRDGLVDALLRDVGRRLKAELAGIVEGGDGEDFDTAAMIDLLDDAYRLRGYARLTAWMLLSGWRSTGSGMFRAHADALHERRVAAARTNGVEPPPLDDSLHTVALLNLVAWAEPLAGAESRRSVGLPASREAAANFRSWLATIVQAHLAPSAPRSDG